MALVLTGLGTPIADVVLEVSLLDELLDLILKGDAFFRGVADIPVVSVVLILVPLRVVSNQVTCIRPCAPWSRIHPHVT